MISINNLTKVFQTRFSQHLALADLSLKINAGETFGLLGPNGAGKTTAVKLMAGLLFPTKGEIKLVNHPAGSIAAKQIVGYMPENPQFYRHLNANEILQFVGKLFGLDSKLIKKRAEQLLTQVGLTPGDKQPARKFSKGMHQRLALAVALINDPEILILDEPFDGLDPIGRIDFKRLILKWQKQGKTIFFNSHILVDVEELCSRVAIINQGRLLSCDTPAKLRGSFRTLEESFVNIIRHAK